MGTNYYWFKEKQKKPIPEGLHIGKLSCGWAFHFQAYSDPFQRQDLMTYKDWKELLQKGYIYDEYEEPISYKKFIKLIESTRPKGKTYEDLPKGQTHIGDEWVDAGFMFSLVDFC